MVAAPPPRRVQRAVPVVLRDGAGDVGAPRASRCGGAGRATAAAARSCCSASAVISVGILPQALQRPDSAHLLWVTCVSWPFAVVDRDRGAGPLASADRSAPSARRRSRVRARASRSPSPPCSRSATTCCTPASASVRCRARSRCGGTTATSTSATTAPISAMQAAVDELAASAEPGDRLLVGPSDLRRTWYSDVFVYWLLPELDPATYFIEMDPGLANDEGSRLADRRRVGRLDRAERALGRLVRAQRLDRVRLRRAQPGDPRPLLRGGELRGRPRRALPPLPVSVARLRTLAADPFTDR